MKENEASLREQMTVNVSQDLYSLPKTLLDLWSSTEDLEVPVEFSIVRGSSDTAALMFSFHGKICGLIGCKNVLAWTGKSGAFVQQRIFLPVYTQRGKSIFSPIAIYYHTISDAL